MSDEEIIWQTALLWTVLGGDSTGMEYLWPRIVKAIRVIEESKKLAEAGR